MPQQEQYRQRSYAMSREALELINELGLSANPINYAVFFAYVEKSNDDLVALIDILRGNKRALDDVKCHELYQRFIDPSRAELLRETMSHDMHRQVSDLIDRLAKGKDVISTAELRNAAHDLLGMENRANAQQGAKA